MSSGKEVCRHLKAVRREIAEQNGIELHQEECTHEGPCQGTCARCEQEVAYLENKLSERKRLGKAVSIVGIAATIAGSVALTACNYPIYGGVPYNTWPDSIPHHPHDTVPGTPSDSIPTDTING